MSADYLTGSRVRLNLVRSCFNSLAQDKYETMCSIGEAHVLTITNPEILQKLVNLPSGLFPFRNPEGNILHLVIKCPKEWILAAKMNGGFRFYLAPLMANDLRTHGLVSAFYDDRDEPLTLWSPLFDDEFTVEISELLSSDKFNVHFFDEHNRELLGYKVANIGAERFSAISGTMDFAPFSFELARDLLAQLPDWFGNRTSADDDDALVIIFEAPLFPDDLYILDARPSVNSYHGAKTAMHTVLERDVAGHFNELDIVCALQRIFENNEIYLSPMREDNGKEFLDVLVVTTKSAFLIQAKDSPNTERILRRSIERKKSTIISHLKKAVDQMRGSIAYTRSCTPLKISTNGKHHEIDLGDREVIGLIVVKELFNTEFSIYSPLVMGLYDQTRVPCFIFDYPELHNYTFHLGNEDALLGALEQVFSVARERGEIPRLQFGLNSSI